MQFKQRVAVPATRDQVWFLMDVPAVVECIPGVESFEGLSEDLYRGTLRVRVGPVSVRLDGEVDVVERDATQHRARMKANATDRFVHGGVSATLTMTLADGKGWGNGYRGNYRRADARASRGVWTTYHPQEGRPDHGRIRRTVDGPDCRRAAATHG